MQVFKIGDIVTWESQANGTWKTKSGKIVEVVTPWQTPQSMRKTRIGSGRSEESYVVATDDSLNWPLTSKLKLVDEPKVAAPTGCPSVNGKNKTVTATVPMQEEKPKMDKKTLNPKTSEALKNYQRNRVKMVPVTFTVPEPVAMHYLARGKKAGFTVNQSIKNFVVSQVVE